MTPKTQKIIPAGIKENCHVIIVPNELPAIPVYNPMGTRITPMKNNTKPIIISLFISPHNFISSISLKNQL